MAVARIEPRTPLARATSALPLSYNNQTTTSPHNPLFILHRGTECFIRTLSTYTTLLSTVTQRPTMPIEDQREGLGFHYLCSFFSASSSDILLAMDRCSCRSCWKVATIFSWLSCSPFFVPPGFSAMLYTSAHACTKMIRPLPFDR